MAGGSLIRGIGAGLHLLGPYVELTLPAVLAVVFASGLFFKLATARPAGSQYFLLPTAALTIASIGAWRHWHWLLRGVLHAAALASLWMLATNYVQ